MIRGFINICSDEELKNILNSSLQLLEKVGMQVPSNMLLDYLENYGARVNREKMVAQFPPDLTRKTIELARKSRLQELGESSLVTRQLGESLALDFGYETFFLYDWDSKQRRRAKEKDIVELIHLGDALDEISTVGLPVLNSETDQAVEAIEACELLYLHTRKHRGAGIRTPEQVKYMIEMDKILGYDSKNPHFVQEGRCMVSPLKFGKDACGIFEELIKNNYKDRFWVATMPLAGVTSPVTIAGNVAIGVAEILGGWSIAKAVNVDCQVSATIISGVMDMRTSKPSFAAPEACLQDACLWQLFKRLHDIEIGYDPGGYIDAKVPGIQAAFEKTFKQMALGMFAGLGPTLGALDGAKTFSPAQAMIDLEFSKALWRLFQGVEASGDCIPLREMVEVGFGEEKTYLEAQHTLKNFRECLWFPDLLDRTIWQGDDLELGKEKGLVDRANLRWKEVVKRYEAPPVDADRAKAIHGVVERARRELVME